jgi:tetratricopeptide (TPR) repeat protein
MYTVRILTTLTLGVAVLLCASCGDYREYRKAHEQVRLSGAMLELVKEGKYAEAIPLLERLVVLADEAGDKGKLLTYMKTLASFYRQIEQYDRAAELLGQALTIYRTSGVDNDWFYDSVVERLREIEELKSGANKIPEPVADR